MKRNMFVYRELFIATQDHVQLIHLANIYTKLQQKGGKKRPHLSQYNMCELKFFQSNGKCALII